MDSLEEFAIIKKAVNYFGFRNQCLKAIEEMAELTKDISSYLQGDIAKENLSLELADVYIMVNQLSDIVGVDLVRAEIDRKLERLKLLIEDQKSKGDLCGDSSSN